MVRETPLQARNTYNGFVGKSEAVAWTPTPEREEFLLLVRQVVEDLRRGGCTDIHSVDFGTGYGVVAVATKQMGTGRGITAGVDMAIAVLKCDGKHYVAKAGFTTSSKAPPEDRITLLGADASNLGTYNHLRGLLPLGTQHYDIITGFAFFSILPFNLRAQTLRSWASLLAPHGRVVVAISLDLPEDDGDNSTSLLETAAGGATYSLDP